MNATEKKYVEKLKDLIDHLINVAYDPEGNEANNPIKYLQTRKCKLCIIFILFRFYF